MSSEPNWDRMPANEIAASVAINARACALHLRRIEILLGVIAGILGVMAARQAGWL